MINLHASEIRAYLALERLIFIYLKNQAITQQQVDYFYFLGGEHSLCRDIVSELLADTIPDVSGGKPV